MLPPEGRSWGSIPDRKCREYDKPTEAVIGCAVNVHKSLGPGLPEAAKTKQSADRADEADGGDQGRSSAEQRKDRKGKDEDHALT
jgi:hypothetical protein